jgi:hypothetical protein
MKLPPNEKLLDRFRGWRRDEVTGKMGWCIPHHIISKGMGGGTRLDVAINLVAVTDQTHARIHAGFVKRKALLAIIGRRHGMTAANVLDRLHALVARPKHAIPTRKRTSQADRTRRQAVRVDQREVLPSGPVGEELSARTTEWQDY